MLCAAGGGQVRLGPFQHDLLRLLGQPLQILPNTRPPSCRLLRIPLGYSPRR